MIETIQPCHIYNDIELQSFGRRPTSIRDIRGLLTLCRLAIGNVLEIGAWYGKTTYELATRFPEKTFYTIDYLENELSEREQNARATHVELCKHAEYLENVVFQYEKSSDFNYDGKDIGMVFIDGNHSYEGVKADTEKALKEISGSVGIICWHDSINRGFGVPHYLEAEIDPKYERKLFEGSQLSFIEV